MADPTEPRWTANLSFGNEEATAVFARSLIGSVSGCDTLLLSGQIGTGKSHFARALIAELLARSGRIEDIPSPTFTLVQTYESTAFEIWHCDLYRLTDLQELDELGLFDAFDTGLCLVEWPDRLGRFKPKNALELQFSTTPRAGERRLGISARDPKWDALGERLRLMQSEQGGR